MSVEAKTVKIQRTLSFPFWAFRKIVLTEQFKLIEMITRDPENKLCKYVKMKAEFQEKLNRLIVQHRSILGMGNEAFQIIGRQGTHHCFVLIRFTSCSKDDIPAKNIIDKLETILEMEDEDWN